MKKAKDIIEYKDVEIEWCWQMFDHILDVIKNADPSDPHISQITHYANYGLKGRKDAWDE